MPGFNKKRTNKRSRVLTVELQGVFSECISILQEAGFEIDAPAQVPHALRELLVMAQGPGIPPEVPTPPLSAHVIPIEAELHPDDIELEDFDISRAIIGEPRAATTYSGSGQAGRSSQPAAPRSIFEQGILPDGVTVPATQQADSFSPPEVHQPYNGLNADKFQDSLKGRLDGVGSKLRWSEELGRYVGGSHGAAGGGALKKMVEGDGGPGTSKPTKELTPVAQQRDILGRVLGKKIEKPADSGIPGLNNR